jgi:hypothetical protein
MFRENAANRAAAITLSVQIICFLPCCGERHSAPMTVGIEDQSPRPAVGPLSLTARPYVQADGTPTVLLTLTNTGADQLFMEAGALPWNRLDGRRVQVVRDGRPFTDFQVQESNDGEGDWEESLMPGAVMLGYVGLRIGEPGRYMVQARASCTFAKGNKEGPVKTVPLAIGPVAIDVPARTSPEAINERQRTAHEEFIARANDHLSAGDFPSALWECTNAEEIEITTETRELRKRILDERQAAELSEKADAAMEEKDFTLASNLYGEAMQIQATENLEEKHRRARAMVLYGLAADDLGRGDQNGARAKITQSLWYFKTAEAESLQSKLASTKPAAQQ